MPDPGDVAQPQDLRRARFVGWVVVVLALHLAMLAWLAATRPWTQDEYSYLKAGTILRMEQSWAVPHTTFHGPLPFLANQMFAWVAPVEPAREYFFYGRLGMLSFALLAGVALVWLCCLLFDRRHALFALVLHALNPVVLANAPLMTADMAMAASFTLAIACAAGWMRRPTHPRLLIAALAVGAALATKYLNLFLLPVLGVCLLRELWATRRRGTTLAGAALTIVAGAGVAILALHTCYLWAAPRWQPPSDGSGGALSWPIVRHALTLLPEPFVRGAAFQKLQSDSAGFTPFFDSFGRGHVGYFAVSVATKLPIAAWIVLLVGLVRGRPWPARSRLLLALAILLPFAYLSWFSVLQNGIRNLLPTLTLATVVGARGAVWLYGRGWAGRTTVAVLGAWLLGCHVLTWPRYGSAFNLLAGSRPYLIFADSNLDWSTAENSDAVEAQARHPQAHLLRRDEGPRFGELMIRGTDMAAADPRDPTRVYHWLRRFVPHDRIASWCVFTIDASSFAGADHADAPRSRVELAIALLGDGRASEALAALEGVADPDRDKVSAAAQLDIFGKRDSPEFCQLALLLGRGDLVLTNPGATRSQRAFAHWARREVTAVCELLEEEARVRPLDAAELNLLSGSWFVRGNSDRAFEVLDRAAPPPGAPGHEQYLQARRALEAEIGAWQRLITR